jgi:hypothetical protein
MKKKYIEKLLQWAGKASGLFEIIVAIMVQNAFCLEIY